MSAITDRLGIGDEIRELKLGRTLTSRDPNLAFHTIRYDFKPASVDREKTAQLEVESNNKVTVTAANTEGSGTSETVFKGSRKAHQKECVLIIDHKTGEITLEKLNQNITVKRTRQQNPKSGDRAPKQLTSGRPNTPIDSKKLVPQTSGSQQKPNTSPLNTNRQNSPNNKQRLSPQKAGSNGPAMSQLHRSSPSLSQPISPSMPTLSSLSSMSATAATPTQPSTTKPSTPASNSTFAHKRDINEELGLSDSSSDSSDHESSSSSSDSSNDSDSSDDNEPTEDNSSRKTTNSNNFGLSFVNNNNNNFNGNNGFNKTKVNQKSDHFSSDSDSDNDEFETVANGPPPAPHHNGTNGTVAPVLPSMPKFSQLSEDLRLSESGSDSEED